MNFRSASYIDNVDGNDLASERYVHVAVCMPGMQSRIDFCVERATREGEEKTKEKVAGVGAGREGWEKEFLSTRSNAYPR